MAQHYLYNSEQAKQLGKKPSAYHTFDSKLPKIQQLINQALHILDRLGIPIGDKSVRQLERMGMAFLALCDVRTSDDWSTAKSLADGYSLKTRDIIDYNNAHFGENLSRGSYDDIRRKDLKHLALASIVIPDQPESARNNPNRAWAINPEYINLIRAYRLDNWQTLVDQFFQTRIPLRKQLATTRSIPKVPIKLPSGIHLAFGPGSHNQLQKKVIEDFLPRYGHGASVIYVGDAENKFLHYDEATASRLGLVQLAHAELPDVIAYSANKNWLYLIEAVHSSGPISIERIIALEPFLRNCTAAIIYVTAFLDRATFRKFVADIAWETEVWIAAEPDHLIHFDGDKFLGPYMES